MNVASVTVMATIQGLALGRHGLGAAIVVGAEVAGISSVAVAISSTSDCKQKPGIQKSPKRLYVRVTMV